MSYITGTAAVAESSAAAVSGGPCTLAVLGHDAVGGAVYLLERAPGALGLPRLHAMPTRGRLAGRMLPVCSWYEGDEEDARALFPGRLAALRDRLTPMAPMLTRDWILRTRVRNHGAVRLPTSGGESDTPVRTFELVIAVRPVTKDGVPRLGARTAVTAYLRPRARLDQVLAAPDGGFAVALVSYVGVPHGIGHDKHVALFVPLEPFSFARAPRSESRLSASAR